MAKENLCEEDRKLTVECEELRNQIKERDKKLLRIGDKIRKHSTFDINLIGIALAELITAISGRKFVYDKVQHVYYYKNFHDALYTNGYEYYFTSSTANIVVAQEKYKHEYYDTRCKGANSVEKLVETGDAVRLVGPDHSQYFTVYPYPEQCFKFDVATFDYIEPFMQALIEYCCANGITETTEKEKVAVAINKCLAEFLKEYKKEHAPKGPTLEKTKEEN